jgi:hypothetical protein
MVKVPFTQEAPCMSFLWGINALLNLSGMRVRVSRCLSIFSSERRTMAACDVHAGRGAKPKMEEDFLSRILASTTCKTLLDQGLAISLLLMDSK